MAAMACHDGFGEGKYVQSAAPAKQGYKKCPPRPQPGGLDVPIVHCSVFEEGTLLLAAKRHSNPLPGKWQNRDVRINPWDPMGHLLVTHVASCGILRILVATTARV
jgi:hypothetical protein